MRKPGKKQPIGVMEIFFGPAWPKQTRLDYAAFLSQNGFDFYIYGPKADANLRKHWAEAWSRDYLSELGTLANEYRRQGVKFGVALSPYGLHEDFDAKSEKVLKEKVNVLNDIGIDMLGIFFDDMPNAPGLAARQIEIIKVIRSYSNGPLVFCPSFYSFDPILDRVFGQRDPDYLNEIGEGIPADVDILWTGPKVISDEIPADHLIEVTALLKRKPFICDNLFANDGPKNCKFIKFKNPGGRNQASLDQAHYWAFNPMNQPEISKLAALAGKLALESREKQADALGTVWDRVCSKGLASWLKSNRDVILSTGLDGIADSSKEEMRTTLSTFNDPASKDLIDWLNGNYSVGNECLTD